MREGKGYDVILQAFSGMMSITGEEGGAPARSPFSPVDQATGFHALTGILAALLERARTGKGALIEASLFDSALAFLAYFFQGYWEKGTQPVKSGSGHESLCPYQAFQTADKFVLLGVANDALWRKFCAIASLGNVVDDPRFRTNADRVKHRAETVGMVQAVMITRGCDEWVRLLDRSRHSLRADQLVRRRHRPSAHAGVRHGHGVRPSGARTPQDRRAADRLRRRSATCPRVRRRRTASTRARSWPISATRSDEIARLESEKVAHAYQPASAAAAR